MFKRFQRTFQSQSANNNANEVQVPKEKTVQVEQQGFICPMCMKSYGTAVDLQSHFQKEHDESSNVSVESNASSHIQEVSVQNEELKATQTNHSSTNGDQNKNNGIAVKAKAPQPFDSSVSTSPSTNSSASQHYDLNDSSETNMKGSDEDALKMEINDLQKSLKEEKWYTNELKKELGNIESERERLQLELESHQQQIKISCATNEELAKQKQTSEQKAATVYQQIAELKAMNDELRSAKEAIEERSNNQIVELEKAATWVRDLESQLLQRPGADDVMVLKKELVSVQHLMDEMSQESERRGEQVERERAQLEQELRAARDKAVLVEEDFARHRRENERLKDENERSRMDKEETSQILEAERVKMLQTRSALESRSSETVVNMEKELASERAHCARVEQENNDLLEEKSNLKEELIKLRSELESLKTKESEEKKLATTRIEKLNKMNDKLEEEIASARQLMIASQSDEKAALKDATKRLELADREREELNRMVEEANDKVKSRDALLNQSENICDQLREEVKAQEIEKNSIKSNLEIELSQHTNKFVVLETSHKQLLEKHRLLEEQFCESRKSLEEERDALKQNNVDQQHNIIKLNSKLEHLTQLVEEKTKEIGDKSETITTTNLKVDGLNASLNEAKQEIALANQHLQVVKGDLSSTVCKLNEEIKRSEEATQQANRLREEKGELMGKMEIGEGEAMARVQVEQENNELRKNKEQLELQLRDLTINNEKSLTEVKGELSEARSELRVRESKMDDLQTRCEQLRNDASERTKREEAMKVQIQEKSDLVMKMESERVIRESQHENLLFSLQKLADQRKSDNEALKKTVDDTNEQLQQLREASNKERERSSVELATVKGELSKTEANLKFSEEEKERTKKQLAEVKEDMEKERGRLEMNSKKLEEKLESKIASVEEALASKSDKLEKMSLQFSSEQSLRQQVENNLTQTRDELSAMESSHESSRARIESLLLDVDRKRGEVEEERRKLTRCECERDERAGQVDQLRAALDEMSRRVDAEKSESSRLVAELESRLKESREEMASKEKRTGDRISQLEGALEKKSGELVAAHEAGRVATEKFNAKMGEMERESAVLSEKMSGELKDKANRVDELVKKMEDERAQYEKNADELKKEVEKSKEENELLKVKEADLKKKLVERDESAAKMEKELNSQIEDVKARLAAKETELKDIVEGNQKAYDEMKEEIAEQNEKLKTLQEDFERESKKMSDDYENLEALQLQTMREKTRVEAESKREMDGLLQVKSKLEEQLERAAVNLQRANDQLGELEQKLVGKERMLEKVEAEREVNESRLNMEIRSAHENMEKVREEWLKAGEEVETSRKENDELRGRVVVLEVTVQNNADERRSLMERCLKFEQSNEQLEARSSELKTRLDEALSAMHELGRENQALQVKHATTISRQWTDDRSSKECSSCKRVFTITVRRHHCRHCGGIYCNDCSSKTATVAASKNPVRVCDRCFDELRTV